MTGVGEPALLLHQRATTGVGLVMPMAAGTSVVGNLPQPVDLEVYQGDTFALRVVVSAGGEPAELAGYVSASQIRATPPAAEVLAEFDVSIEANVISLSLAGEQTATLPARGGWWDVQITAADGRVTTLLRGRVRMLEQVTR